MEIFHRTTFTTIKKAIFHRDTIRSAIIPTYQTTHLSTFVDLEDACINASCHGNGSFFSMADNAASVVNARSYCDIHQAVLDIAITVSKTHKASWMSTAIISTTQISPHSTLDN